MLYHGNMRYYTVKEVAKLLNLSYIGTRSLIQSGKLEAVNVGCGKDKIWRISEEQLSRFININLNKKEK